MCLFLSPTCRENLGEKREMQKKDLNGGTAKVGEAVEKTNKRNQKEGGTMQQQISKHMYRIHMSPSTQPPVQLSAQEAQASLSLLI